MTYKPTRPHTAALVLANGAVFYGHGIGYEGAAVGEVSELGDWLAARKIIGLSGVDTRALTSFIRDNGMPRKFQAYCAD